MTVSIMFWSVLLIVKWLTRTPTISGVLSFIFPLLMLPLLASAYAEVNYEGLRVLQVRFHPLNLSQIEEFLSFLLALYFFKFIPEHHAKRRSHGNVQVLVWVAHTIDCVWPPNYVQNNRDSISCNIGCFRVEDIITRNEQSYYLVF